LHFVDRHIVKMWLWDIILILHTILNTNSDTLHR
jgi:hypothetical protein